MPYWLFRFGTAVRHSNLHQNSVIMKQLNLPPQPVLQVLENCCSRYEPLTVYIFGHRTDTVALEPISNTANWVIHHFYLVVFTNRQLPASGSVMANSIYELSGKTITATVLLHKPTDLATKNPQQLRFFDGVLRYGHRLCLDKEAVPYILHNNILPPDREEDMAFWLKCVAVAKFNINAASESPHLEVELCKIALLNTACVQIALGLIRGCIGYTPNEFGLKYLLQLCEQFTTIPSDTFNQKTPKAIQRYKMLCTPPSMLNHWTKLSTDKADFGYLLDATQQFLDLSKELVEKQFPSYAKFP